MSDIIKTTAKFQEAAEPLKQRPIIQIERPLPNTIRASVDSGRDNPFRPDGKIYKSADPIVDFYKFGPNQSRPVSPTESELLLTGGLDEKDKKKLQKELKKKRKKLEKVKSNGLNEEDGTKKKSCWRRWLCCCCCCNRNKNDDESQPKQPNQTLESKTKDFKQTKIVVLKETSPEDSALENSVTNANKSITRAKEQALDVKRTEPTLVFTEQPRGLEPQGSSTQVNNKTAKSSKRCIIS